MLVAVPAGGDRVAGGLSQARTVTSVPPGAGTYPVPPPPSLALTVGLPVPPVSPAPAGVRAGDVAAGVALPRAARWDPPPADRHMDTQTDGLRQAHACSGVCQTGRRGLGEQRGCVRTRVAEGGHTRVGGCAGGTRVRGCTAGGVCGCGHTRVAVLRLHVCACVHHTCGAHVCACMYMVMCMYVFTRACSCMCARVLTPHV